MNSRYAVFENLLIILLFDTKKRPTTSDGFCRSKPFVEVIVVMGRHGVHHHERSGGKVHPPFLLLLFYDGTGLGLSKCRSVIVVAEESRSIMVL
jgi:hypothetical protein